MKTVKFVWPNYYKDSLSFTSFNNTWINNTQSSNADISVYVDQMSIPINGIAMLIEPYSIHPGQYEYVLSISNKLKKILSFDEDYFGHLENFIKIPPPFGAWIDHNERQIYNKTKNVSFIASTKNFCKEHSFRHEMVSKFSSVCDVYGKGRTEIRKKVDGLRDYRFSICMENYNCNLYYTEKLLDCFLTGTIPIFWGSKKITDIFDGNGIIFLQDILDNNILFSSLDENLYISKLNSINKNFNIANSMKNSVSNSIDSIINLL